MSVWPTIMGSEIEWSIVARRSGAAICDFFADLDRQAEFVIKGIGPPVRFPHLEFKAPGRPFLSNGGRVYFDFGQHFEYATPESLGVKRLVINEKSGERITEDAVKIANERWLSEDIALRLYKNNIDSAGNTWGAHDNYLVFSGEDIRFDDSFVSALGLHRVSMPFYAGNGHVREASGRLEFFLSQRLLKAETVVAVSTTAGRAIINTRSEPLADASRFRRIHLILGDSLLFEAALILKYGTTAMVIDAIMAGYLRTSPLDNVADLLLNISKSFVREESLREGYEILGKTYTQVDIQEMYRGMVYRYFESARGFTAEDKLVFGLWERVIDAARKPRPHEELSPFVDWAAKRLQIEMDMEKRGYGVHAPDAMITRRRKGHDSDQVRAGDHVAELNLLFHEVSPRGLARKLMDKEGSEVFRITTDAEIEAAMHTPTPDSRAYARHRELLEAEEEAVRISAAEKRAGREGMEVLFVNVEETTWSRLSVLHWNTMIRKYVDVDPFSPEPHEVPPDVPYSPPYSVPSGGDNFSA